MSSKRRLINFYKQNDKSNNLNSNSYNLSRVCSVAGYHRGLRSTINNSDLTEFLGFIEFEGLSDKWFRTI